MMLRASAILEKTNIPITYSILHDIEYRNLHVMMKKQERGRRRAFTEINRRVQKKDNPFYFFTE